uniref:Uncharacterized protein n=1 Tax=Timema monikensis TaxID=170555 RepID=A0A7R9HI51_9NEOP|nr:unnamed protein product [Timema monikensis]
MVKSTMDEGPEIKALETDSLDIEVGQYRLPGSSGKKETETRMRSFWSVTRTAIECSGSGLDTLYNWNFHFVSMTEIGRRINIGLASSNPPAGKQGHSNPKVKGGSPTAFIVRSVKRVNGTQSVACSFQLEERGGKVSLERSKGSDDLTAEGLDVACVLSRTGKFLLKMVEAAKGKGESTLFWNVWNPSTGTELTAAIPSPSSSLSHAPVSEGVIIILPLVNYEDSKLTRFEWFPDGSAYKTGPESDPSCQDWLVPFSKAEVDVYTAPKPEIDCDTNASLMEYV